MAFQVLCTTLIDDFHWTLLLYAQVADIGWNAGFGRTNRDPGPAACLRSGIIVPGFQPDPTQRLIDNVPLLPKPVLSSADSDFYA